MYKGQRASYAMQNTSAQLLFPIRLDSLKLARDSLKVVAGSPRDLLKILANGSPINTIVVLFLKGGGGSVPPSITFPLC